jgi:hypothetical protein
MVKGYTMDQSLPDQFFTWTALGTLAGASSATFVITSTLRVALDWSPKWIGLLVAQVICIGASAYLGKSGSDFVIAILNGCLVYLSAVGIATASSQTTTAAVGRGNAHDLNQQRRFFSSWF